MINIPKYWPTDLPEPQISVKQGVDADSLVLRSNPGQGLFACSLRVWGGAGVGGC